MRAKPKPPQRAASPLLTADQVVHFRLSYGWSPRELAEWSGYKERMIRRMETGASPVSPRLDVMIKRHLAEVLERRRLREALAQAAPRKQPPT